MELYDSFLDVYRLNYLDLHCYRTLQDFLCCKTQILSEKDVQAFCMEIYLLLNFRRPKVRFCFNLFSTIVGL